MSNLNDVVGGSNLISYTTQSYTADRFGNQTQAITLNPNYLIVPSGKYFCGAFTTITWIKLTATPTGKTIFIHSLFKL